MTKLPPVGPFIPRVALSNAKGDAARWWNQAMQQRAAGTDRRALLIGLGLAGVAGAGAFAVGLSSRSDDDVESSMDALDLQRRTSWDVGDTDRAVSLGNTTTVDVDGSVGWQAALIDGRLDDRMAPQEERLRPFYSPTLFQAPARDAAGSLRRNLMPITRPSMEEAYDRGRALGEMFEAAGRPRDTALVIDMPGPDAVAAAAGLAGLFAPVFTFDNWPHPRGVVPSHETLAAALYYLPVFERANATRPTPAPPMFVLDNDRLAYYRDEVAHFDNRYTVSLPSQASLQQLGVQHIMYVRASDLDHETDDLNSDFASLDTAGIPVRAVALSDFHRDADGDAAATTAGAAKAAKVPDAGAPATASTQHHHRYHYGGGSHVFFWGSYGWYSPAPSARPLRPGAVAATGTVSKAASYRPVSRPTMFSSRTVGGVAGVGKLKPSGFGRVSVRTSRSSGAVSVSRGRSGSFGRGSSSSGG